MLGFCRTKPVSLPSQTSPCQTTGRTDVASLAPGVPTGASGPADAGTVAAVMPVMPVRHIATTERANLLITGQSYREVRVSLESSVRLFNERRAVWMRPPRSE